MAQIPDPIRILGIDVHPLDLVELLNLVEAFIKEKTPRTITYANAHVLNTAYRDDQLRRILLRSDICYCDGNGVHYAAQFINQDLPPRMTGADWIWDLAAKAENNKWKIHWLGGEDGHTKAQV